MYNCFMEFDLKSRPDVGVGFTIRAPEIPLDLVFTQSGITGEMDFPGLEQAADQVQTRYPEVQTISGAREYLRQTREFCKGLPTDEMIPRCLVAGMILGRAMNRQA